MKFSLPRSERESKETVACHEQWGEEERAVEEAPRQAAAAGGGPQTQVILAYLLSDHSFRRSRKAHWEILTSVRSGTLQGTGDAPGCCPLPNDASVRVWPLTRKA